MKQTLAAVGLAFLCSCAAIPSGTAGPEADALARQIEANVRRDRWEQTGAVAFQFRDNHAHLWDRTRGMHYVKSGELEVWLDLWDRGGVVKKGGAVVEGEAATDALADAWAWFCNDTFWLNPLVKLFDDGSTRELVRLDGARALKVTYGAGGVTPGDTYLWLVDEGGAPRAVRMWVAVLPVKGLEFSWDGWIELQTGARIATAHATAGSGNAVALSNVRGAATLAELVPGDDPFAALVARRSAR
jgi:hypothetical protein